MITKPVSLRHNVWNREYGNQSKPSLTSAYLLLGYNDLVYGDVIKIGNKLIAATHLCDYYGDYTYPDCLVGDNISITMFDIVYGDSDKGLVVDVIPVWDYKHTENKSLNWNLAPPVVSLITTYGKTDTYRKVKLLMTTNNYAGTENSFHVFEYNLGKLTHLGSTDNVAFPNPRLYTPIELTRPTLINENTAIYPVSCAPGLPNNYYTNILDISDAESISYSGTIPYYMHYKVSESNGYQYWFASEKLSGVDSHFIVKLKTSDLAYEVYSNKITPVHICDDYAVIKSYGKCYILSTWGDNLVVIDATDLTSLAAPTTIDLGMKLSFKFWHTRGDNAGACYNSMLYVVSETEVYLREYKMSISDEGYLVYGYYDISDLFRDYPSERNIYPNLYYSANTEQFCFASLVVGIPFVVLTWRLGVIDFSRPNFVLEV